MNIFLHRCTRYFLASLCISLGPGVTLASPAYSCEYVKGIQWPYVWLGLFGNYGGVACVTSTAFLGTDGSNNVIVTNPSGQHMKGRWVYKGVVKGSSHKFACFGRQITGEKVGVCGDCNTSLLSYSLEKGDLSFSLFQQQICSYY